MRVTKDLSKLEKTLLVASIENWKETARHHLMNECYYRSLLVEILGMFGSDAYTCDDGSISDAILVAKAPELVKKFITGIK